MATRIQANKAMKEELKSFEMCIKMISVMKNLPDVKEYLTERGITASFFTEKAEDGSLACKKELFKFCKLETFVSANGVKYQAIFRKDKSGNIIEAKWSIWKVLLALDARYKEMQKQKSKDEYAVKEKSIEEIEAGESVKTKAAAAKAKRTRRKKTA